MIKKIIQKIISECKKGSDKILKIVSPWLIFLVVIGSVIALAFLVFPKQSSWIVGILSWGQMTEKNNIEIFNNKSAVLNNPENKLQECDSDFKDNKWSIEGPWLKDPNDSQRFISLPDNQFGGPKMKYGKPISDNFHLTLDFIPITNENNSENEMNLVVYVGNLYKIVVGDGNNENFYFKKDDKFISTLKKEQVLPNGKISFPNKIRFDEWVTIDIDQNIPDYSTTRTITINFFYTPYGGYKKENLERRLAGPYTFEINDSSPPDKVSREIRIGLVSSKNTIITGFKCFKLENY